MPIPLEAYRAGYEKARQDDLGGTLAEVTMGMLSDDPGGHFAAGYHDGAARKKFNPPSTPTPSRPKTDGLIPKFSENPAGWFFGVIIVVEFWALWQLIKAPFQLIGALMRSEKPSPSVVVRNAIVAGLAVALMWWVHYGSLGIIPAQNFSEIATPNATSLPAPGAIATGHPLSGSITSFTHSAGSFKRFAADGGASYWVEYDASGAEAYHFAEMNSDNNFIQLYDKSRGLDLRLPVAGGWCAWRKGDQWNNLYNVTPHGQ